MVCPSCQREYDAARNPACPHCGRSGAVVRSGAVKKSLVLISSGRSRNVYGSVEEVPEALRKKLVKSTSGLNSATVLIADRRGRRELARAIRSLPVPMQGRLLKLILGSGGAGMPRALSREAVRVAAIVLAGAAAFLVWLAFTYRG